MANNAADIRQILNLIESVQLPTILNEGPFTGLKAAFGDGEAQGSLQRADLADRMKKEWSVWLGQTARKGDMDDLVQFLNVRVGLEPYDIQAIMGIEPSTRVKRDDTEFRDETPNVEEPDAEPEDELEDEPVSAAPDEPNSYSSLTPAQKAELDANGKLELPNGKTLWVGKPGEETPPPIRSVKDADIEGAADYIQNMDDDEFEDFIKQANEKNMKRKDWSRLRDELFKRQQEMTTAGQTVKATDLQGIVSQLEKEVDLNEALLSEAKLGRKELDMVFDTAAKYVFANGVLNRTGPGRGRGSPSGVGYDDEDDEEASMKVNNKLRAFLRNNDVTDEMVHSLRETARRARGLGSFKGAQDHKVLAMIGLAYLKYRD